MYPVDFLANSKTSHESVKVSVPEAWKVASVECSKVFLSSGSDTSGMYITILVRYSTQCIAMHHVHIHEYSNLVHATYYQGHIMIVCNGSLTRLILMT